MPYSRKLEQEKMEAPGEHAADTSYMYTFRQWASMKKKKLLEISNINLYNNT
jgi:hypothetical protein